MQLKMIKDLVSEQKSPDTVKRIADARAKVKRLKKELSELPTNPGSQAGYDALDDARAEVDAAERELASLTKQKPVKEAADDASVAYNQRFEQIQGMLSEIDALVNQHKQRQEQSPRSWGHAGDLAHVAELLGNVTEFLTSGDK